MSDRGDESLGPDERAARVALAELSRPRPDPQFRARLKREFVAGTVGAPRRIEPREAPWWRGLAWSLAPVAAALVIVVWWNRGPSWTLASVTGAGTAIVDGRLIPVTDRNRLERALSDGGTLRLEGDAALELVAGRQMAIEVVPGSDAVLPPSAGRWFGRAIAGAVRSGELRITTGRDFRGARLAIATPEARVEVTGTTLAVIREPVGTCVCVMEGRVRIGLAHGDRTNEMLAIEAGRRRFFFNDGRAAEEAEMRPVEKTALGEMHARLAGRME
jgi:ferric-dicitrate binding protein FerR (iron transport regulator)